MLMVSIFNLRHHTYANMVAVQVAFQKLNKIELWPLCMRPLFALLNTVRAGPFKQLLKGINYFLILKLSVITTYQHA